MNLIIVGSSVTILVILDLIVTIIQHQLFLTRSRKMETFTNELYKGLGVGRREMKNEISEIIQQEMELEKVMTNDKTKHWINTTLDRILIKIKETKE